MKILSFPHVVIDELVKHIQPAELVRLSLCSKKAHALVKTFWRNRAGYLTIRPSSVYRYHLHLSRHFLMNVVSKKDEYKDTSNFKTAANGFRYNFDEHKQFYTCWEDVVTGCRETTNYICELFKIPLSIVFIACEHDLWQLDFVQKQKMKKVQCCNYFNISSEGFSRIMSFNNSERTLCFTKPPQDFQFDGKLPSVKSLHIAYGGWITREHLLGLESEYAAFFDSRLTSLDINALLRRWLNGGFRNLKCLRLGINVIDNQFYEGISDRLVKVDRVITYTRDVPEIRLKFNANSFHLRRDDQTVATVKTDHELFVMVVWPDSLGNRV